MPHLHTRHVDQKRLVVSQKRRGNEADPCKHFSFWKHVRGTHMHWNTWVRRPAAFGLRRSPGTFPAQCRRANRYSYKPDMPIKNALDDASEEHACIELIPGYICAMDGVIIGQRDWWQEGGGYSVPQVHWGHCEHRILASCANVTIPWVRFTVQFQAWLPGILGRACCVLSWFDVKKQLCHMITFIETTIEWTWEPIQWCDNMTNDMFCLNVKVMKSKQAQVSAGSNFDSLKVAKWFVI